MKVWEWILYVCVFEAGLGRCGWDALRLGGPLEWGCVVEDSTRHNKAFY